jgi:hypothetical protein
MNKQDLHQPTRPLSVNFTDGTLRQAIRAKRRNNRSSPVQGLFTMKQRNFLKQPAGALVALAIIILGGASVYAAANWFGGSVQISTDQSVITVDLSKCQGKNLPPGIEPASDRSNIKFKITGTPHINEGNLQRKLLANCEWQAILEFYQKQYNTVGSHVGVVRKVDATTRTITINLEFGGKSFDKTFPLTQNAEIYNKGMRTDLASIKSGDFVMFAYDVGTPVLENENPFDRNLELKSIFKTQYDLREVIADGKSLYGAPNNIMPLQQYEEVQNDK